MNATTVGSQYCIASMPGARRTPLENSSLVLPGPARADAKGDCKGQLNDDKGQLDPEADSEDTMVFVMDSQSQIFEAHEDCAEQVTATIKPLANVASTPCTDQLT